MAECKDEQHRRSSRQFWCVCFVLLPGSRISQGTFTASLCRNYDCDWPSAPIKPGSVFDQSWVTHLCGRSSGDSSRASLDVIHLHWKLHSFAPLCSPPHLFLYFATPQPFPSPFLSFSFLGFFLSFPKCLNVLKTADFFELSEKD